MEASIDSKLNQNFIALMEASIDSKLNQNSNVVEEDIFSTLPKQAGLNVFNSDLVKYQGFWYPDVSLVSKTSSAQQQFQAQPDDIFLCSAPKTGTTWLKALAVAIISRTTIEDSPLLHKFPHNCLPALEFIENITSFNRDPKNPLIGTHVPYSSLPKSVSDCKIVYICRDPKDTFVSMYHFFDKVATSRNMNPIPLDKAFEYFCNGESSLGPYWDHVLGYWKASLDYPDKILFLKYEDLKEDTKFYVTKMAEFMGYGFSLEEQENGVVEKIVSMCNFENLSSLDVNKNGKVGENTHWEIKHNLYFRKGKVNDWEKDLTPEMALRLDSITEQKLSGSGLNLLYRHVDFVIKQNCDM